MWCYIITRAFSRHQRTHIIESIHKNDLIYVDAASSKRAEDVLALLRKSAWLVTCSTIIVCFEPLFMTTDNWLLTDSLPEWLFLLGRSGI